MNSSFPPHKPRGDSSCSKYPPARTGVLFHLCYRPLSSPECHARGHTDFIHTVQNIHISLCSHLGLSCHECPPPPQRAPHAHHPLLSFLMWCCGLICPVHKEAHSGKQSFIGALYSGASSEPGSNSVPSQTHHCFGRIPGDSIPGGKKEAEPPGCATRPVESPHAKADSHHTHFSRRQTEAGAWSTVLRTYGSTVPGSALVLGPYGIPVSLPSPLAPLPAPTYNISRWPGESRKRARTGAIPASHPF